MTIQDGAGIGGFGLLVIGLMGYDWRMAAIAAGALLLTGAIAGLRG